MADSAPTLVYLSIMIHYALFFFAEFALLFFSNLLRNRALSVLASALAVAFCGLRFETGYDYNSYRAFFEDIWSYEGLLEPGFYYFIYLGNTLGISTSGFFLLFALATHGLAFHALSRMSIDPNLAFLLYLLTPGLYLNSFSVLRSALAVSIFAYAAFKLISRQSKLEYLGWAAIAISFHFTAALPFLVAFIIYLGPRQLPARSTCLILFFGSLMASQLPIVQTILNLFDGTKFDSYSEWQERQGALKIIASSLLTLFIFYHVSFYKRSEALKYFFKIWLVGVTLFNVFLEFTPVTRITYYFGFFSIPLLVHAASVQRNLARAASRSALIIFFSAAFVMALYNDSQVPDLLNMSDYKTIFEAP